MGKFKRSEKTYHITPPNHRCKECKKGRDEANFGLNGPVGYRQISLICNKCKYEIYTGCVPVKKTRVLKKVDTKVKRKVIRERIRLYFISSL